MTSLVVTSRKHPTRRKLAIVVEIETPSARGTELLARLGKPPRPEQI